MFYSIYSIPLSCPSIQSPFFLEIKSLAVQELPTNHSRQFLIQNPACRTTSKSSPRSTDHLHQHNPTMASLAHTSRTLLRTLPSRALTPLRALSTTAVRAEPTSSFDSPFKGTANDAGGKIPDFSHYRSKQGTNSNLLFQYFMVGTMGALTAAGAKATVQGMFFRESCLELGKCGKRR
jgi:hypothetical protein